MISLDNNNLLLVFLPIIFSIKNNNIEIIPIKETIFDLNLSIKYINNKAIIPCNIYLIILNLLNILLNILNKDRQHITPNIIHLI